MAKTRREWIHYIKENETSVNQNLGKEILFCVQGRPSILKIIADMIGSIEERQSFYDLFKNEETLQQFKIDFEKYLKEEDKK